MRLSVGKHIKLETSDNIKIDRTLKSPKISGSRGRSEEISLQLQFPAPRLLAGAGRRAPACPSQPGPLGEKGRRRLLAPRGDSQTLAGWGNLLPQLPLFPTHGDGEKGMKINGILSTLATKGNEKEIGRKLDPEARSAGEYFHIKKQFSEK